MNEIHVNIGEVKVSRGGIVLKALLGSCVGIAIFHPEKKRYGLAHCLLPKTQEASFKITGRFVNRAIPSLIALLKIKPEQYSEVFAVVAGGGNMMNQQKSSGKGPIGVQNTKMALKLLKDLGIKVIHKDIGGDFGRRIFVSGEDGSYKIEHIPREVAA